MVPPRYSTTGGGTMDQNRIADTVSAADYGRMTAHLVSAYVRRNNVPVSDLPTLIASAADALIGLKNSDRTDALPDGKTTPAQIRGSITHEALISFEDGKGYKTLKRHLTACGLTPETYRAKWSLPSNYPMVAPGYSERRSAIAVSLQIRNGYRPGARKAAASRA
ncbi:MucR family transcriptional regulator [Methylobacterium oryzae CBMB20]|uniref:MucR family transcriptional regulator n=3 Tax=Methylobacteriaceae TaxID=119045 RepID=A0A089NN58_9HYPH|nr:MucR family transcriptional regulator [Methylobacterium oryzae CBMB20]